MPAQRYEEQVEESISTCKGSNNLLAECFSSCIQNYLGSKVPSTPLPFHSISLQSAGQKSCSHPISNLLHRIYPNQGTVVLISGDHGLESSWKFHWLHYSGFHQFLSTSISLPVCAFLVFYSPQNLLYGSL